MARDVKWASLFDVLDLFVGLVGEVIFKQWVIWVLGAGFEDATRCTTHLAGLWQEDKLPCCKPGCFD